MNISNFIFGDPLKTENLASEQLSKTKALAVFASDVLSSVAYATEAILISLGIVLSLTFPLPIALTITGLLFIVICSYWHTLKAYPKGGGAFAVAKDNLGEFFGLITAAALFIDYTLTVAVSLSAGASAIVSAFPGLSNHVVSICVSVLVFIAISNLRGTQESAGFFAIPTYCFIGVMFLMILCGLFADRGTPNLLYHQNKKILLKELLFGLY